MSSASSDRELAFMLLLITTNSLFMTSLMRNNQVRPILILVPCQRVELKLRVCFAFRSCFVMYYYVCVYRLQKKQMKLKDERLKLMNQVLSGIKVNIE